MTDLPILQPANEPDLDPLLIRLGSMATAGNLFAAGTLTGLLKWLYSESSPLIQKVALATLAEAMERATP